MNEAIAFTKKHENLLISHESILLRHENLLLKLEKNVSKNSDGIHKLGILMEDQNQRSETMLEILTHIQTRFDRQDKYVHKIDNHEHRISAIESSLK